MTSCPQARPQHLQLSPTLLPKTEGPQETPAQEYPDVQGVPGTHNPAKPTWSPPTRGALPALHGKAVDLWGGQGVLYGAPSR